MLMGKDLNFLLHLLQNIVLVLDLVYQLLGCHK
jgi:hypothetical protein